MHDIIIFFVGMVVGAMNAIAGGGLLIGFPVMVALGVSPLTANVTGHVVVMPGLVSSVYGFRKYIRKVPRKYMWLMLPVILGAAIGAVILGQTTNAKFEEIVPVLILFSVILFAFQPFLHHQLHKHIRTKSKRIKPLILIGIALLPLSIYGGYFGAGFGFVMLAFLGFTKLHDMHQMNGLKSLAGLALSVVTTLYFLNSGIINWHFALVMGLGTAVGGYYSAVFSQKVSNHSIRIIVIVIGLSTALYLSRSYL